MRKKYSNAPARAKSARTKIEGILVLLACALMITATVFLVLRSRGYLLEGKAAFALMLFIRLSYLFFAGVIVILSLADSKKTWVKIILVLCLCALPAAAFFSLRNPVRDLAVWPSYTTETVYDGYFQRISTNSKRLNSVYYRLKGLTEDGNYISFDLNKSTYKKYEGKSGYTFKITCTPYTKSVISVELQ